MRIVIATSSEPFVFGGAVLLVDWLAAALEARGHEVEVFKIPVYTSQAELGAQMVGLRLWDFSDDCDLLITVRTPSYLIRHPRKVVWFIHHLRGAYDLWDSYPDVPDDGDGREHRRMLFSSDEHALAECRHIFTNSQRVADRLRDFNGIAAEVLYPPLGGDIEFQQGPYSDALVYVSRVVPGKRQQLAVEALAHTSTDVRLIIAGTAGDGHAYAAAIRETIRAHGLADRVVFDNQLVSEARKVELLRDALGVVYLPLDEDSYGYVGLEAAAAAKPLVTVTDSGGVLELVSDDDGGVVVEPTPEALGAAYDRLFTDRELARQMGQRLAVRAREELNISWDHCIDRLLS